MFQSMLIGNTIVIFLKILLTKKELKNYSKTIIFLVVIVFIFLDIYNAIIYKNKNKILKEHWKYESIRQNIKRGYIVFFALLIPWVTIIMISFF